MTGVPFPARVPELTDGVVRLRAHRPEDAERIVAQSRDPESMHWTTVPRPYGLAEARDFLARIEREWNEPGGERYWAVTDAGDPESSYLGTVHLHPRGGGAAEVGFGLHPQARGSGFMAGAVRLACRWWFGEGGARVHWLALRGNFASWRVAWSCGFSHHGTIPQAEPDPDAPAGPALDVWRASLGADDPMEPRTPWEDVPVLEVTGHGIRLRPWRDRDIEALEPRDQPDHYMPARGVLDADTFPEWLLIRREQMSLGRVLSWCAADTMTDAALGEVLVFVTEGTLDDDTAELGYQVVPSARGRGVATNGTAALVTHAFAPRADGGLGMRRLVAQTADDNAASNTVLDRLGFTIWGRETAADVLPDGRAVDALHWELLRG